MTKRKGSGPADKHEDAEERRRRSVREAADRALAEAEKRRAKRDAEDRKRAPAPKEIDGADGPEPVRYGDWENKGRASDF